MIQQETYIVRRDGVTLVRTYSDAGRMIENEDGARYAEAIDETPLMHTYTETSDPVPYGEVQG